MVPLTTVNLCKNNDQSNFWSNNFYKLFKKTENLKSPIVRHHQIRQFPSCQSEYYDCIDLRSMTLPKKDASWFVYITFPPREHCWSYWGPVDCLWFSDWSTLNQHAHLLWRNHDNLGCSCFKEAWKSYCCVQVVGYTCDQRLHICLGPCRPQNVCK